MLIMPLLPCELGFRKSLLNHVSLYMSYSRIKSYEEITVLLSKSLPSFVSLSFIIIHHSLAQKNPSSVFTMHSPNFPSSLSQILRILIVLNPGNTFRTSP